MGTSPNDAEINASETTPAQYIGLDHHILLPPRIDERNTSNSTRRQIGVNLKNSSERAESIRIF